MSVAVLLNLSDGRLGGIANQVFPREFWRIEVEICFEAPADLMRCPTFGFRFRLRKMLQNNARDGIGLCASVNDYAPTISVGANANDVRDGYGDEAFDDLHAFSLVILQPTY